MTRPYHLAADGGAWAPGMDDDTRRCVNCLRDHDNAAGWHVENGADVCPTCADLLDQTWGRGKWDTR